MDSPTACSVGQQGLTLGNVPTWPHVAALYVTKGGCYFGLEGVDPWDEARDARTYAGPWPVIAHPPCQRWGRFWHGSTRKPHQPRLGGLRAEGTSPEWRLAPGRCLRLDLLRRAGSLRPLLAQGDVALCGQDVSARADMGSGPAAAAPDCAGTVRLREGETHRCRGHDRRQA
jgi:hypothetical protein